MNNGGTDIRYWRVDQRGVGDSGGGIYVLALLLGSVHVHGGSAKAQRHHVSRAVSDRSAWPMRMLN